jgi:hypothetical protein
MRFSIKSKNQIQKELNDSFCIACFSIKKERSKKIAVAIFFVSNTEKVFQIQKILAWKFLR